MTLAKPPTPMPIPLPPLGSELLAAQLVAAETAAEPPELRRWVSFWLGEARYALEIRQLREVLAETRPEPVPGAPAAVLGVINLRGEIVTLLDLGRWLGQAPARADGPVLVLEQGGYSLGLREAGSKIRWDLPAFVPCPRPRARARSAFAVEPYSAVLVHKSGGDEVLEAPMSAGGLGVFNKTLQAIPARLNEIMRMAGSDRPFALARARAVPDRIPVRSAARCAAQP